MAIKSMVQAINAAMDVALSESPDTLIFGQDAGYFGGVFRATEASSTGMGWSAASMPPITEAGIISAAIGMGAYGLRPIVEIQFIDYLWPGYDQLISEAAKLRYRSAGEFAAPITVRTPYGGGIFGGMTHSQSPEALFSHIPGLKTVIPSNPYDAKGLLLAAIAEDDPVIFMEPKRLYNGPFDGHHDRPIQTWAQHAKAEVPDGYYTVPLGQAAVVREGSAATVLAYGTMVHVAESAIAEGGHDAELIDLRSIVPLDVETIAASVKKTGRCVIVHEATKFSGFGAELVAQVQERCFYHLKAPIERVCGYDTPYPHTFEWDYFVGPRRVDAALKRVLEN